MTNIGNAWVIKNNNQMKVGVFYWRHKFENDEQQQVTMTTTNNNNKDGQRGQMMTTDNNKQRQRWQQTMKTNMDNN
jgi:hypothetical protein